MAPISLLNKYRAPLSTTPNARPSILPSILLKDAQPLPNGFITSTSLPSQHVLPQARDLRPPGRIPFSLLQHPPHQPVTLGTRSRASQQWRPERDHPYLMLLLIAILFIVFVFVLLRCLNSHEALFDSLEAKFRRFSKGTSRYRYRPPAASLEEGKEADNNSNRKTKNSNKIKTPWFVVKSYYTSTRDCLKGAIRTTLRGRQPPLPTVRGYEGQLHAPLASRPWMGVQGLETGLALGAGYHGYALPPPTTANSPPPSTTSAHPTAGTTTAHIVHGVPPILRSARPRKTTVNFEALGAEDSSLSPTPATPPSNKTATSHIPHGVPPAVHAARVRKPIVDLAALAQGPAQKPAPEMEPRSVLRQQFIEDFEASSASHSSMDQILLQGPRGEQRREGTDLEGLEGKNVSRASQGPRKSVGDRRSWISARRSGAGDSNV